MPVPSTEDHIVTVLDHVEERDLRYRVTEALSELLSAQPI